MSKLFTTMLDEDLHKKVKVLSTSLNKKIKELIEEALIDLLKKYEDQSK